MNPRKSHPGHRPRMTLAQIHDSNRLRMKALSAGCTPDELAKITGRHVDTIRQWLSDKQFLPVECQDKLNAHWNPDSGF